MRYLVCFVLLLGTISLQAELGFVPHEYESQGGYSLGLNNGGTVGQTGLGAIRANPGMLAAEKKYEINASYMWPTSGREVYRIGAVDSMTSMVALGILYTGHRQEYTHPKNASSDKDKKAAFYDSAVTRRISAGIGFNFSGLSLGFGGGFVDGTTSSSDGTSGVTLNLGAVYEPIKTLRVGFAVENLINDKVKELAPLMYRAGISYSLFSSLGLNLDYAQRQRVPQENSFEANKSGKLEDFMSQDEKTLIVSGSYTFQDMLTFALGYGRSFDISERNSMAGSISFSKSGLFISYSLRRPYFVHEYYNHTLHASYHVNL